MARSSKKLSKRGSKRKEVSGEEIRSLARILTRATRFLHTQGSMRDGSLRVGLIILPHREMVKLKTRATMRLESGPKRTMRAKFPNVLAFPEDTRFPDPDQKGSMGEIYLNASVLRREGFPRAAYLVVHGLLHLLGYDHKNQRDMIRMERWEARIMRHLFVR